MPLSDTMDEILHGLTVKLVCTPHKAVVCGTCCMDFSLLNQLRPTQKVDLDGLDPDIRLDRLDSAVQNYYQRPDEVQHATGQLQSPYIAELLQQVHREQDSIEPLTLGRLVAYVCFVARTTTVAQERIVGLMDTCLCVLPDYGVADVRSSAILETDAINRANRKVAKKDRKSEAKMSGKGREYQIEVTKHGITEATDEMMLLMVEAKVASFGKFFDELIEVTKSCDDFDNIGAEFAKMGLRGDEDSIRPTTAAMKKGIEQGITWLSFILKHSADAVPLDDVSAWPKDRSLEFLRKHEIDPKPLPSKSTLAKIAKHLVKFCLCAMEIINNMPEDDEAEAMGRQAMGTADKKDWQTIRNMNAPINQHPGFLVHAQIQDGLRLESLRDWMPLQNPPFEDAFRLLKRLCMLKFNLPENIKDHYYRLLLTLQDVGYVYDYMVTNPEEDLLLQMEVAAKPDDQLLSVRPLAAWIVDEIDPGLDQHNGKMRVPLVAVEWFYGRKVDGSSAIQTFAAGLRKGTKSQVIDDCRLEDIDLFIQLLEKNRQCLADDDFAMKTLEKHCTDKGWKFSVIRAMDPNKKGNSAKGCALCNQKAGFMCIRCGSAAYCGKECQKKDWKVHKKTCKAM